MEDKTNQVENKNKRRKMKNLQLKEKKRTEGFNLQI